MRPAVKLALILRDLTALFAGNFGTSMPPLPQESSLLVPTDIFEQPDWSPALANNMDSIALMSTEEMMAIYQEMDGLLEAPLMPLEEVPLQVPVVPPEPDHPRTLYPEDELELPVESQWALERVLNTDFGQDATLAEFEHQFGPPS